MKSNHLLLTLWNTKEEIATFPINSHENAWFSVITFLFAPYINCIVSEDSVIIVGHPLL